MIYVIIAIVIVILVVALVIFGNYMKLKDLDENCEVASSNIEELLVEKKSILDNAVSVVDDEKINALYESYNQDDDLFKREDVLFNVSWEINKLFNNFDEKEVKKLKKKNIDTLISDLVRLEESLQGLREYYNRNVLNYNEKYNKMPFTIIYNLFKFKSKKSFKLRTLEEYEILKN